MVYSLRSKSKGLLWIK